MFSYIELLKLEPHIEGGYFAPFYKSSDEITPLAGRYQKNSKRNACTSIYFLLAKQDFSAWHKVNSDEIWHYYDGDSCLDIYIITKDGGLKKMVLGNPLVTENASFQVVIQAGDWFAAEVRNKESFALVGCAVSPGFEYIDFVLADRADLEAQYPKHASIINRLTRLGSTDPKI